MSQSVLDEIWRDTLGRIPVPTEEQYAAARRVVVSNGAEDLLPMLDL